MQYAGLIKPESNDEGVINDLDGLPYLETSVWLVLQEALTNALAAAALCFVMYDEMSVAAIPVCVSSPSSASDPARSCLYFL
jgi:hypothetical protein